MTEYTKEWAAQAWKKIRAATNPVVTETVTYPADPDADDSVFERKDNEQN